jgi:hypothetical protein
VVRLHTHLSLIFTHGCVPLTKDTPDRPRPDCLRPRGGNRLLAEFAPLHAGTSQQLAVLLLRHPLTALLDHRTHVGNPRVLSGIRRLSIPARPIPARNRVGIGLWNRPMDKPGGGSAQAEMAAHNNRESPDERRPERRPERRCPTPMSDVAIRRDYPTS